MAAVELAFQPEGFDRLTNAGVYLGSFDPLHRGHEWVIGQLLDRFGGAIVLVPARHFHKEVRYPQNATLEQRLELLVAFARGRGDRIAVGVAGEVLFVRLARALEALLPGVAFSFALGDETYSRLADSASYFSRSGLAWTSQDEADLRKLCRQAVILGRGRWEEGFVKVPATMRTISSTMVRATIGQVRIEQAAVAEAWRRLAPMISWPVWQWILRHGLYPADERLTRRGAGRQAGGSGRRHAQDGCRKQSMPFPP